MTTIEVRLSKRLEQEAWLITIHDGNTEIARVFANMSEPALEYMHILKIVEMLHKRSKEIMDDHEQR